MKLKTQGLTYNLINIEIKKIIAVNFVLANNKKGYFMNMDEYCPAQNIKCYILSIDNIFIQFGELVLQQTINIPIGTTFKRFSQE